VQLVPASFAHTTSRMITPPQCTCSCAFSTYLVDDLHG